MASVSMRALMAACAALLISRILVLLLAARPDNPGIGILHTLTDPLVWPVAWIDNLQPVYGARFERGTLLEVCVCIGVLWWLRRRSV